MATRREVRKMLDAGHSKATIAKVTGVSLSSVKRIEKEPEPEATDWGELQKRRIGRPSTIECFREMICGMLDNDRGLTTAEILERLRVHGYKGGKTTLYSVVSSMRARVARQLRSYSAGGSDRPVD